MEAQNIRDKRDSLYRTRDVPGESSLLKDPGWEKIAWHDHTQSVVIRGNRIEIAKFGAIAQDGKKLLKRLTIVRDSLGDMKQPRGEMRDAAVLESTA